MPTASHVLLLPETTSKRARGAVESGSLQRQDRLKKLRIGLKTSEVRRFPRVKLLGNYRAGEKNRTVFA